MVEHSTLTDAARALHIAQPSLSQAIAALERELGAELFHRTSKGLVLTAAGEALVAPARQVTRDVDSARAAVRAVLELAAGRLDLATLPTLAVEPLARLVGAFRRRHPQVTLRLVEPETAPAVGELVREGSCELGFAHLPLMAGDLVVDELWTQELLVAMPPGKAITAEDPLPLAALGEVPMVVSPPGTSTRMLLEQSLLSAGLEPQIAVETASREAIVPLVLRGAGATILPAPLAREARRRGALIRPTAPPIRRAIGLVRRDAPLSPAARAFLELALAASR